MFLLSRWKFYGEHKAGFVILGYGLACAGFWGYLNVTGPAQLFLVQLIFGLGEAIGTPAWDGLYSWFIKADHFVLRWGEYDAMYNIVVGIAAVIGGWLASLYGFRFLFTVMFTFSLAGLLTSTCLVLGKR
jgi:MFS family permease